MSASANAIRAYFDGWNAHDVKAILATLTSDGTYSDPVGGSNLSGPALESYVSSLYAAFPDLRLELVDIATASNGMIAAPWLLFGTHEGLLQNIAPTRRGVVLPGCDFITVEGDKISEVRGYFDPAYLISQLHHS